MRRRLRAERGQTSVEYLGVVVVVAVIVAGLAAAGPGVGNVVGTGLRRAVCLIVRSDSCPASGKETGRAGGGGSGGHRSGRTGVRPGSGPSGASESGRGTGPPPHNPALRDFQRAARVGACGAAWSPAQGGPLASEQALSRQNAGCAPDPYVPVGGRTPWLALGAGVLGGVVLALAPEALVSCAVGFALCEKFLEEGEQVAPSATEGGGDRILLGLQSSGIEEMAPEIGARTLMQSADFRMELLEALQNPTTRFTVQLQGLEGSTPAEQIANAIRLNAEHAFPSGGITNWEIAMLDQYGRLSDATLLQGKTVVANPFAGGG